jgi:hypothetical protein
MSAPLMPSPLDHIGRRRFSFFPPIRNAEPNEWMLAVVSWSEIKVVNARTGREVWMPRQYINSVSCGGPMPAVGITKELEYSGGILRPHQKYVIEMPLARHETRQIDRAESRFPGPAPVIGIRLENREDSHTSKALALTGIGAIIASVLAALLSELARV